MQLIGRPAKRREKVFGHGPAIPLDRNAKARIWHFAVAYTARHRQPGQHRGPLTRAALDVLRALLWQFHNQRTGRCFPSYEAIAEAAHVCRATVARAIEALEAACVLTWHNRLLHEWTTAPGLCGPVGQRVPRRTSNAYILRDPQRVLPKSQNPTGTRNQDLLPLEAASAAAALDPSDPLDAALIRLGRAIAISGGDGGEQEKTA